MLSSLDAPVQEIKKDQVKAIIQWIVRYLLD